MLGLTARRGRCPTSKSAAGLSLAAHAEKGTAMIIKTLEIRDEGTCVPMLAIKPIPENEAQRAIIRHAGYGDHGENYVILIGAHDCEGHYNPADQHGRTRQVAH